MKLIETFISGLYVIDPSPFVDNRGFFARSYCKNEFSAIGFQKEFVQFNHSFNLLKGTVRGMHFQRPPHAETKYVRCVQGSIYDVAIDIRRDSPTYLKYFGIELNTSNLKGLLIPEGFAHGFQTLTHDCEILYFHTADYNPNFEVGLNALDPNLAISWPKPIAYRSQSDTSYPFLSKEFTGLDV
jgi:dTDP-4-dehydrorhamnose 3,5-epimerase